MRASIDRPNLLWRLGVVGGVGVVGAVAFSDSAYDWWEANVGTAVPRWVFQAVFVGTAGLHVAEALLARRLAAKAGIDHRGAWNRTTFVYGYPALRRLIDHIDTLEEMVAEMDLETGRPVEVAA